MRSSTVISILFKIAKYVIIIMFAVLGSFLLFLGFNASQMPPLERWHTEDLPGDDLFENRSYNSFKDYLQEETRFMEEIYNRVAIPETTIANRYARNNAFSSVKGGANLNQSFYLNPADDTFRGGILLVHGLTDSPYHMRAVARLFSEQGYYVIGIRLPGHGTIPGALKDVTWQDWYKAVQANTDFVLKKIEQKGQGQFIMAGFSTGGALILRYTLENIISGSGKIPDKLLQLSPAIGIDPLAFMSGWYKSAGWIPGLEKFNWLNIDPEYDPYKYNSMAYNAANQIYELTEENRSLIEAVAADSSAMKKMPQMYAVQSIADATVQYKDVLWLYESIAPKGSEILLFDVNHRFDTIINADKINSGVNILNDENSGRVVTLVSNKNQNAKGGRSLIFYKSGKIDSLLQFEWPNFAFALSHVCIPISPDDSVYGRASILGGLNIKGETGVLNAQIEFMRLRYNPMFPVVKEFIENKFFRN